MKFPNETEFSLTFLGGVFVFLFFFLGDFFKILFNLILTCTQKAGNHRPHLLESKTGSSAVVVVTAAGGREGLVVNG